MTTNYSPTRPDRQITRLTQYGVTFDGKIGVENMTGTREACEAYIANAIAHGLDASRYGLVHRTVTLGPWDLTYSNVVTEALDCTACGHPHVGYDDCDYASGPGECTCTTYTKEAK